MQLICFPCAGKGASVFARWGAALGKHFEVSAVQLPGREARVREHPVSDAPALIEALVPALRPFLRKPFVFFGHSLGALLAFETVRVLRRERGQLPQHLFVAARFAPQFAAAEPSVRHLADREFLAALQHRFGGIPKAVLQEPELLAALLPSLRADVTLLECYQYTAAEPIPCSITALGGTRDAAISSKGLQAWAEQTRGRFRLQMIEGDHFFVFDRCREVFSAILSDLCM